MQNQTKHTTATLYIALLVAFIDFFGVGLVYPLFSSLLFDPNSSLIPVGTSSSIRGVWLGVLIAMTPIAQFFFSPLWGSYSDGYGRKKPLQQSLGVALLGYTIALIGMGVSNIYILLISRIVIGVASGNTSIVQASIADLSNEKNKAKNFALYSMALGLGFTLGPFLGGTLSAFSYSLPFLVAACITTTNLIFALFFYDETNANPVQKKLKLSLALSQLRSAFQFPELRSILIASFLFNFGWSFFFEFAPVFLIERYQFTPVKLGFFYGTAACLYALSTGILIRPFLNRHKPENLFFLGMLVAALSLYTVPLLPSTLWFWPIIFILTFFVSFVLPTSTTMISNLAKPEYQGEALGLLNSVNAASFAFSPLLSGSFVGFYPSLPMWFGGSVMIIASLLFMVTFRSRLLGKA